MKTKKHLFRCISVLLSLALLVQVGTVGFAANSPEDKPETTERVIKSFSENESLIVDEIIAERDA